jgi:glucose-1-phosphate thymidylyltransferase
VSKQLLPVYDKPMIYYPISTLMLAGIREILIITTPHDQSQFMELLGDGSDFGVSFQYEIQLEPKGLAQALIIGEKFLAKESCLLILGDNIFHGAGLGRDIIRDLPNSGAHIFTYEVSNPRDYGILEVNRQNLPVSIIEKPTNAKSNLAVTGLYYFDNLASEIAKKIKPSERGEVEITSVIEQYLESGNLSYTHISRGSAWLDTGNPNSMHDASSYVRVIEERTGLKIGCLEEIAFENKWISQSDLEGNIKKYQNSRYGAYLRKLISVSDFENQIKNNRAIDFMFYLRDSTEGQINQENSVSVVIPVFSPDKIYFQSMLRSLLLQEYKVDEHIFVFDGWYENWAESEIRQHFPDANLIRLEKNIGQGGARNKGVEYSSSKWVAFLDQDDLWDKDHLCSLVSGSSHGEFSIGYSDIREIDHHGEIKVRSMMSNTVSLGRNSLIKKDISDLLFRDLMIFPSSAMVDRVKFLEVGGFGRDLKGHEDDYGFRKLLERYPNHFYCKQITASWRNHASGTSTSFSMSESRLAYSVLLFNEYEGDKIIRDGIASRLANSFLRELISSASDQRDSDFYSYRENCHEFVKVARGSNVHLKFRYKVAFRIRNPKLLLILVNSGKFLRKLLSATT